MSARDGDKSDCAQQRLPVSRYARCADSCANCCADGDTRDQYTGIDCHPATITHTDDHTHAHGQQQIDHFNGRLR